MTQTINPVVPPGAYGNPHIISAASVLNATVASFTSALRGGLTTSTAWPAAKVVVYYPISIAMPFLVKLIYWQNGTTPSGNIEVGVYDEAGNRKGTSGSTAAGTTVQVQTVTPTPFLLNGPARYYIAVTCDGTGYTICESTTVPSAGICAALGVMTETTGSFGLTNPWGSVALLTATETIASAGLCDGTVL